MGPAVCRGDEWQQSRFTRSKSSARKVTRPALSKNRVTLTGAVPTVWLGVIDALEKHPGRWQLAENLRIVVAGSACPETLFRRFDKLGVKVIQPWGMTETTPIATVCTLKPNMNSWPEAKKYELRAKQGLPSPFIEIRAMADDVEVPWDGETVGELEIRGPFIAAGYLNLPEKTIAGPRMAGCGPVTSSPLIPKATSKLRTAPKI